MSGEIHNGFIYLVALNPSTDPNPTTGGPLPVVGPPWGNGFVAGHATHFVQYDVTQSPHYLVYQFQDPDLNAWAATGAPVLFEDPATGGAILHFELLLSQITPSGATPDQLQSLQVNFLTMNRRPQGSDTGGKVWDALGNSTDPSSVNDFVKIPLNVSRTYTNLDFGADEEPEGDVADPDLDITSWSVEVRRG